MAITASDAHRAAGISYRQCDHWARRGWVRPSIDLGEGRSGRRLYAVPDVVRLDLLRHLAVSRVNTAVAGPVVAGFVVPDGDVRVLWGPLGDEATLVAVPASLVLKHLEGGGGWVLYNPADVLRAIRLLTGRSLPAAGGAGTNTSGDHAERLSNRTRRSA